MPKTQEKKGAKDGFWVVDQIRICVGRARKNVNDISPSKHTVRQGLSDDAPIIEPTKQNE